MSPVARRHGAKSSRGRWPAYTASLKKAASAAWAYVVVVHSRRWAPAAFAPADRIHRGRAADGHLPGRVIGHELTPVPVHDAHEGVRSRGRKADRARHTGAHVTEEVQALDRCPHFVIPNDAGERADEHRADARAKRPADHRPCPTCRIHEAGVGLGHGVLGVAALVRRSRARWSLSWSASANQTRHDVVGEAVAVQFNGEIEE